MTAWRDLLAGEIRAGQNAAEIDSKVDVLQLVFELEAMTRHANFTARLMNEGKAYKQARAAIRNRLLGVVTRKGRKALG